jgi:hypothetical protein
VATSAPSLISLPGILPGPQSAQTAMLKQMQVHMSALDNKIADLARTVLELRKLKAEAEKDLQSKLVLHSSTTLLVLMLASPFSIRTDACSHHLLLRGCWATTEKQHLGCSRERSLARFDIVVMHPHLLSHDA